MYQKLNNIFVLKKLVNQGSYFNYKMLIRYFHSVINKCLNELCFYILRKKFHDLNGYNFPPSPLKVAAYSSSRIPAFKHETSNRTVSPTSRLFFIGVVRITLCISLWRLRGFVLSWVLKNHESTISRLSFPMHIFE